MLGMIQISADGLTAWVVAGTFIVVAVAALVGVIKSVYEMIYTRRIARAVVDVLKPVVDEFHEVCVMQGLQIPDGLARATLYLRGIEKEKDS
jgi:hypothetical protein